MQTVKGVLKPSKQRRMLYNAPDHVRRKLFAAHLSPELRASHLLNQIPVRSGDTVRIMRGDRKGFEGKVSRIDVMNYRVFVEGLTREKVDGTTVFIPVHPSKVMITHLDLDDKWRKKILERKKGLLKKEAAAKKPGARREALKAPEITEPTVTVKEPVATTQAEKATAKTAPRRKRTPSKRIAEKPKPSDEKTKDEKPEVKKRKTRRKPSSKTKEGEQ